MADRYLLESGSPDGYLLEDGTGVLLLETGVFWDPISGFNKNQFLALTNSNLTSTSDNQGQWETVRANLPTAVSAFRFEVSLVTGSTPTNIAVGIDDGTTSLALLNNVPGSANSNGVQLELSGTGWRILRGGGVSQGPFVSPAAASGQIVTVVVDKAAGTVAFLVDGAQIGVNETSVSFTNWYADVSGKDAATSAGIGNFSGPFSYGTGSAYDGSSSAVSHAATGALTGPGSTIAGTAAHIAIHTTTGALTGPGSTIAGTAAHIAIHTSTGALTGSGSTIVGSAARTREHATTGILTGPGSVIVGAAVYNAKHTTSGALTGAGSVVVGSAARTRAHATTGALTGSGSVIVGAAVYNAKHTTTGALTGPGSTVAGSAARFRAFATSGVLVGPGSTIAGTAARSGTVATVHATSGALVGQPSIIDGIAARTRQHDTSGILTGPPALVVGVVTRWRNHNTSGALLGVTGVVFGRAFNGTPQLHDIPVDSDNLTDEPASPAGTLSSITEPSGQIFNHPPYPAA